jgi:hypothetical protein
MAAQQPSVMQSKHNRDTLADPRQVAQIKIFPMKVMRMDNISPMRHQV